jgi:hypothetical protein
MTRHEMLVLRPGGPRDVCGRGPCRRHAHIHDELTLTKTDTSTGYSTYYNVHGALNCDACWLEWKS